MEINLNASPTKASITLLLPPDNRNDTKPGFLQMQAIFIASKLYDKGHVTAKWSKNYPQK